MTVRFINLTLLFLLFSSITTFAGNKPTDNEIKSNYLFNIKEGKPKVFIEGSGIDFDYLRRNIQYIDIVNDPAVADIHIIINAQTSGSGGTIYSIIYNNRTFENITGYTLTCTTASSDTQEERRKKITDAIAFGLMPFANETNIANGLSIRYRGEENTTPVITEDPWHHWTFRGDFNGSVYLEESRKNFNYTYNLRADKVTENWKIRNNGRMNVRTQQYERNGEIYRSENITNSFSSSVVHSLSKRWSAGTFLSYSNSNYSNLLYSVSAKPAIEYNIFPWDISDRKVFTIAYYIGPNWNKYYEETIYGKLNEGLWDHSIRLNLQLVETWGEVEAGLNASNYLQDFSKNRITFDTDLSVRIVRGFSVNFNFGIERIHDQIYLAKGDVSLEDILLNRVQLPSSFEVSAGVGVRLQFGSIYNNIINNRL